MPTMANWNGHTFEVGASLIRMFDNLSIKGGCETTDKNSDKQKYVERKYGEIPEIGLTVHLNALTGVTNVYGEAMQYIEEATEGATAYFYLGNSKLIAAEMMLVEATVNEVVHAPGRGERWISCDVALKFKQGTKGDGGSGSGGGSKASGNWLSSRTADAKKTVDKATEAINKVKGVVGNAKAASKTEISKTPIMLGSKADEYGLTARTNMAKEVQSKKDTGAKTEATTGKAKVTLMGSIAASKTKGTAGGK